MEKHGSQERKNLLNEKISLENKFSLIRLHNLCIVNNANKV